MRDMKAHRYDHWKAFRKHKRGIDWERVERDAMVTRTYGRAAHNQCGRKRAYSTREEALGVAAHNIRHNRGCMLRAYECPYCGQWHLTSH